MTAPRAAFLVTRRCDNQCVFCGQPEAEPSTTDRRARLSAIRESNDALTLVGGEPALDEELEALVREARALGFREVGLQTNGRALGRGSLAARLGDAGLTDVHVSVHGADAAVHEYHTGVRGSFAETMAGIAASRAANLVVVATTLVTRSSFRSLSGLPLHLLARGVSAMSFSVPWARGRADVHFDRVFPRLGLAMPFVLHATQVASRIGLPAFVGGAPHCLLGPLVVRALPDDIARSYAAECDACPARARCPGLDARYLERFDGDELRARTDGPTLAIDPLTRLFTGLGERGDAAAHVAHEPPRAARRRLPVLARPQPGAQEARRAPARTGEALREILPSLFETKGEG